MRSVWKPAALVALLMALLAQGRDLNSDLASAAQRGDRAAVQALLQAGADPNAADDRGFTALHLASGAGHAPVVEVLLAGGAEVSAKSRAGATALMMAAFAGHAATTKVLLARGADPDEKAARGITPLMVAASAGHAPVVEALLAGGADPGTRDESQRTALLFSAGKGHTDAVRALLARGADVNAGDKWGNSALTLAVAFADAVGSTETVQVLMEGGADLNEKDGKGGTALMLAARQGHTALARMLLRAGARISERDANGRTALMFAAWNNNGGVLQVLLEAGADLNAEDNKGSTTLMLAATPGHPAIVRTLLEAGANVNAKGKTGSTALMTAAFWGHAEVAKALLEAGADPGVEDNRGDAALELATQRGHTEVAQLLQKAGTGSAARRSEPELPPAKESAKPASNRASASQSVLFEDVTDRAGIRFKHRNAATPEKYMPETMGSGGVFFDYDNDGWLDIFLVDGGSLVPALGFPPGRSVLYRNLRDGTFLDATPSSGLAHHGYGMGACAADYNNDGLADLYLMNVGPNALYRNNGDGTFTDVTLTAGVGTPLWSTSCAFGDIDNDGDLDLYVTHYVDFSVDNNKFCGDQVQRVRAYCHPHVYNGVPDILYRNNGDGTFTDITREAGVFSTAGKGLGVVFGDYNDDGWADIYVANDSVPNFLYRNQGDGTFEEVGVWAGVSVNGDGRPEAGMGTDMGDYDNDGRLDIFVTNLAMETNTLYRNLGEGRFEDATLRSGQGAPSLPFVGFGTAFVDYDNDGDLDVIVANGHILDNASYFRDGATYAQPNLLLRNQGAGLFEEVGRGSGSGFALVKVSRGLAAGDIDNDGDLDLLVSNNGQTADLLRNEGGHRKNSLMIRTVGTKSNRAGVGARIRLTVGSTTQLREVTAGSSYLGQNDSRVHFGLGSATRIDRLEVRWPSGRVDVEENLEANKILTLVEGKGVVGQEPFRVPTANPDTGK